MRIFHIFGERFDELESLPDAAPAQGYLWLGMRRDELEAELATIQAALQRWTGGQLVDLHIIDLLNPQIPSNFDYTSWYDLLTFRRLAATVISLPDGEGVQSDAGGAVAPLKAEGKPKPRPSGKGRQSPQTVIDTSPVGFAVFDRVLLTVHPNECVVREHFATRLQQQQAPEQRGDGRSGARVPPSPADMALRMVNFMVDSYLELRRLLTRQLDELQQGLFDTRAGYDSWRRLLESRNSLHQLEDICEDQRAAVTEWIDALDELPQDSPPAELRERELLRIRARDVQEHIERVLTHVRRLESSVENAVQMHFSAQGHRTNDIMRTLTVMTAIFLPLNLVTGFFGMNFEGLPLIHSPRGFWITFGVMLALGVGTSWWFWRKRYIGPAR